MKPSAALKKPAQQKKPRLPAGLVRELMRHDNYYRAPGGALRQKHPR